MDAKTTAFVDEMRSTVHELPEARVVLPWRGEFGIICNWHGPQIKAVASPKIVPIELGMEALYPGAVRYVYIPVRPDQQRGYLQDSDLVLQLAVAGGLQHRNLIWPDQEAARMWFVPVPFVAVDAPITDVVICPRHREHGCGRNWQHWQTLLDSLVSDDLVVGAAGSPWSSVDVSGCCFRAWDHERCLDASIALMQNTKLVVGTDTGLTHLALMCGVPAILLISGEFGRVAGGVFDSPFTGKDTPYWLIIAEDYYEKPNHVDSYVGIMHDTWEEPQRVRMYANDLLGNYDDRIVNRVQRKLADRKVVRLVDEIRA